MKTLRGQWPDGANDGATRPLKTCMTHPGTQFTGNCPLCLLAATKNKGCVR